MQFGCSLSRARDITLRMPGCIRAMVRARATARLLLPPKTCGRHHGGRPKRPWTHLAARSTNEATHLLCFQSRNMMMYIACYNHVGVS